MNIPPTVSAMYRLKYLCDDWRTTESSSDAWNEKLFDFVVKLIQLESRF